MGRAKAEKPGGVRVLVRGEWIEELAAEAVPEPGGSLRVADRDLTVWSVGVPDRHERPVCDLRVRAAENDLLAGWQVAAMEAAQRGWGSAAPRNDAAPPETPASWGVRVRLVAHVPGGRLETVTKQERELTIDRALDGLVAATEEAVHKWSGGRFGVTGRVVLAADGREQLRVEIARVGGSTSDVVGVIDAMEAITVAAERLYSSEGVDADDRNEHESQPQAPGSDADDYRQSADDSPPQFRYLLEHAEFEDPLARDSELHPGDILDSAGVRVVVETIGPPDPDGLRRATVRPLHPDQHE